MVAMLNFAAISLFIASVMALPSSGPPNLIPCQNGNGVCSQEPVCLKYGGFWVQRECDAHPKDLKWGCCLDLPPWKN